MRTVSTNMVREKFVLSAGEGDVCEQSQQSLDDRLGGCLALLRACEDRRVGAQHRLLAKWPDLLRLVGPVPVERARDGTCDRLRDEALVLARGAAVEDLEAMNGALPHLSDSEAAMRRGHVFRKLARLSPGRPTSLSAVMDAQGQVVTDPAAMAACLRRHWADVFAARRVDSPALRRWMRD